MKFVSIIITHWSMNEFRSKTMRTSIQSLLETLDYPAEIIVCDNGYNKDDSAFFLNLVETGKINIYLRNAENMSFGYARTQGLNLCNGDYICIADNDILYQAGWLSACIRVLEKYPNEKIYSTPVHSQQHASPRFWKGELDVDGEKYRLNFREGSNCFVISRQNMLEIGGFPAHRIGGTMWTDTATRNGYVCAITPKRMVVDLGVRKGYNLKATVPIKEILSNGSEIYFNRDSFLRINKGYLNFRRQKQFYK